MARYIDADKLIAHLEDEIEGCKPPFNSRANGKSIAYGTVLGLKSAISFAKTLSTADVVPKSEAENYRKIAEHQQSVSMRRYFEIKQLKEELAKAKQEVAREIFEEIERTLPNEFPFLGTAVAVYLAELKNKYTESEGKETK